MFPYIEFGGLKIYMTGLGIVVSIFIFLFLVRYYTKKFKLDFWKFFNYFPVILIVTYLSGSYSYYIFKTGMVIPFGIDDILMILSPYGYKFSFIGISTGLLLTLFNFILSVKIPSERKKWIDVFLYAMSISIVFMGVFFTLGDDFIGRQTESYLSITSFMDDSQLFKYKKVYPVGLFLSIFGILTFVITFLLQFTIRKSGLGIVGFIFLIFSLNIVFYFQNYPQHFVSSKFGITVFDRSLDIKNYWTILLILTILYYYLKISKIK